MTTALEQSLKKRLSLIGKERNLTPSEVWYNVITERFLVRLCKSPYGTQFIFKGGALLARQIAIGRETRDLDFSIRHLSNEITVLQEALDEIVRMPIDDGFIFEKPTVAPLEHFHMQYSGAQVKMRVCFGKSRFPLFIDLGFGDLIYPQEKEFQLLSAANGPLFESSVMVNCYPLEFVFAEKLETIIYRGGENSRMKDFHDLYSLINAGILNTEDALKAIKAVFNHRKTALRLPIRFNSSELSSLEDYWRRYRQNMIVPSLPWQIKEVVDKINSFI